MATRSRRRTVGEVGAASEDIFDPTAVQRRGLLYRAGSVIEFPGPGISAEEAAAQAESCAPYYAAAVEWIEAKIPVDGGRGLPAEPGPLGAVPVDVAAALLSRITQLGWRATSKQRAQADAETLGLLEHWYHERGIEFIVEAVLLAGSHPLWWKEIGWHRDDAADDLRRILGPVRNRLAEFAPGDPALNATVEVMERYRADDILGRRAVIAAVLLPWQRDWVSAAVARAADARDHGHASVLVDAAAEPEHLIALGRVHSGYSPEPGVALDTAKQAITLVNSFGFDIAPLLASWIDHYTVRERKMQAPIADVLAVIPTDAAFEELIARTGIPVALTALRHATERFPRRALRLLDPERDADTLRELVHDRPELARDHLPHLSPATAELVRAALEPAAPVDDDALPEILRTPPWLRKRPKPAALALTGPLEVRCAWLPEERARWLAGADLSNYKPRPDLRANMGTRALTPTDLLEMLYAGPEFTRPLLPGATLQYVWDRADPLRAIIAAHETEAYPLALSAARAFSREVPDIIMAFESPEVVALVAQWLQRRTLRATGVRYLRRHAGYAARVLIPGAVGKGVKERRVHGRTLRTLAELGHLTEIRTAAAEYGPPAVAAVEAVLALDPAADLPARLPAIPPWVNPAALPPITLRANGLPLPAAAAEHVITMLQLALPGEPYVGLDTIRPYCDTRSLADFGWELYQQWWRAGGPTKFTWVYEALGALGDDDTVALLLADIRERRSDPRSVSALDAFVTLGSDAALLALKTIGDKVKTHRVREGAQARITDIADRRGLTPDQLADRLVPDLGLDENGTLTLDFGPRQFIVGFDERLQPTVANLDGATVKALPKPGAKDDSARAAQAHSTFRAMKLTVRTMAADQIKRLERAMVEQRRFTVEEFRTGFVAHPWRRHITRRLVWGVYEGEKLVSTFRIAEDRTCADQDDRTLPLAEDAELGIAHPLQFAAAVPLWSELFADYELLQPFEQLGRAVYPIPPELLGEHLVPDDGTAVDSTRLLGLTARGWLPPKNTDGAHMCDFEKPLPGGRFLSVSADPGLMAWDPRANPTQHLTARLCRSHRHRGDITFADLDEVTASEVLRDLAWLKAGAQ
ncbi:DUF4132 domain-containing protein [Nocardia sp. NPDC057668]|uniref:DUF4132 domain-containing protein n=1 Tax=Nocardia sp. NPDC057668 TaxID=3346202 RepID=UPI00366B5CE9